MMSSLDEKPHYTPLLSQLPSNHQRDHDGESLTPPPPPYVDESLIWKRRFYTLLVSSVTVILSLTAAFTYHYTSYPKSYSSTCPILPTTGDNPEVKIPFCMYSPHTPPPPSIMIINSENSTRPSNLHKQIHEHRPRHLQIPRRTPPRTRQSLARPPRRNPHLLQRGRAQKGRQRSLHQSRGRRVRRRSGSEPLATLPGMSPLTTTPSPLPHLFPRQTDPSSRKE